MIRLLVIAGCVMIASCTPPEVEMPKSPTQIIKFGDPWLGQDDSRAVDADPRLCVAQENLWMDRPDEIRRRPPLTKQLDLATITSSYHILPLNAAVRSFDQGLYAFYPRLLVFGKNSGGSELQTFAEMVYSETDIGNTTSKNALYHYGAHYVSQTARLAWHQTTAGIVTRPHSFLLITDSSNPTHGSSTYGLQLMVWKQHSIAAPNAVNGFSGGGLTAEATYTYHYRFELRDGDGNMKMCSAWSAVDTYTVGIGNSYFKVSLDYWWSDTYGIITEDPAASGHVPGWDTSYNWNLPVSGGWKYHLVVARALEDETSPLYFADEIDIEADFNDGDRISIDVTAADSTLADEYDIWFDADGATDIAVVGDVFVWTDGAGLLRWGCAEYPYLAPPENWLAIDIDATLIPLDSNTLAVVGRNRTQLVRNIPSISSVEEYPLGQTSIPPGEYWRNGLDLLARTVHGQILSLMQAQSVNQIPIPWLVDTFGNPPAYSGLLDELYGNATRRGTVVGMSRCRSRYASAITWDITNKGYAIRAGDGAAWELPDGHYLVNTYVPTDSAYYWKVDGTSVWANKADEGTVDTAGEVTTDIAAHWQSSWQSGRTPGMVAIKTASIRQAAGSQCIVQIEATDHPSKTPNRSQSLSFGEMSQRKPANLIGKFFRITIWSIAGETFKINSVEIEYEIATAG